jgi:hypothetical protein
MFGTKAGAGLVVGAALAAGVLGAGPALAAGGWSLVTAPPSGLAGSGLAA